MKYSLKRWIASILLLILGFVAVVVALNWDLIHRVFLGGLKVYESEAPLVPANIDRPAVLVFSKTNGFRHEEAIPAANALFAAMAKELGWGYYQTENGATFNSDILSRFDVVIFNNVSGDVFTPDQRQSLKAFIEQGGGFVGVHGAGGDMVYDWQWYVDDLIGAKFVGHTMNPQFQKATVRIEDKAHPVTQGLPDSWVRTDEWYSFQKSARKPGVTVLATLDETTYSPKGMFGQELAMGKDHPVIWSHCTGKGRVLYSAMGHTSASYAEHDYRKLLNGAIRWALKRDGTACGDVAAPTALEEQK